eukprot:7510728-Pyramimonas_sp.AAC.1
MGQRAKDCGRVAQSSRPNAWGNVALPCGLGHKTSGRGGQCQRLEAQGARLKLRPSGFGLRFRDQGLTAMGLG